MPSNRTAICFTAAVNLAKYPVGPSLTGGEDELRTVGNNDKSMDVTPSLSSTLVWIKINFFDSLDKAEFIVFFQLSWLNIERRMTINVTYTILTVSNMSSNSFRDHVCATGNNRSNVCLTSNIFSKFTPGILIVSVSIAS